MFGKDFPFQASRSGLSLMVLFCMAIVFSVFPDFAHASATSDLPFTDGLDKLKGAITGPVAFGVSVVGIIAAGAVLIFGGEMSGFLRTLVFLVLVIAIIVNATNIIDALGGNSAVVAQSIRQSIDAMRAIA